MKRALIALSLTLMACGPKVEEASKDGVDPACRSAETISTGTRLAAATDNATPRYAVKVQGPGELGFAGFVHEHSVTVIDLGTKQVAAHANTALCGASYVALPTEAGGFGQYCVILEPKDKKGYSTFDIDLSAQPHARSAEANAKACGQ